ncbi:MAG: phosphoribosylglycinamide formyltransferase [Cobetia sp.]|jgi:phosphoribosylglycinamide formyltransferase-1|uniref:Phosphoribosylglycinamide formyltransferase n=1 Tax=Cobetia amphilecti TaxID=1055104 RepID=A0AAP4TXE6_9GAMM|nr:MULTISPECIES: phosphoribosylglycinamide formyltransferase [Gammaproteobacteria]AVV35097.1 phosphoribosylglycinamide formyltransferase [Halomonas sp. SF2003]MBR9756175.1 phosphoribosylglycinamide formyltransferase [Gammaproteobacteria bacterium]TCJ26594.1 phosphoribosylglycinamide formyltransferase [Halomonas sp. GDM18]KPM79581.1 phosphoribosylglycinamide formyltransferase [Cobetia sp. UCD-24C]MBE2167350.1 phosphoribosylglycinamide formyltransferase [Cobetia sp. 2AS1]|tara:strand:- start:43332 stop:44108 length:777 start_codon:yes stop_codon:yes gene_type:complete
MIEPNTNASNGDTLGGFGNGFEADDAPVRPRVVVLISGSGSNLQALLEAQEHDELGGDVVAVISNKADAYGLVRARDAGVDAVALPHEEYESREHYDAALIKVIERHEPDLIVLAGFMRILSPLFVQYFFGRLMNIHPSLLPAWPGLDTHRKVLEAGEKEHGASVHFVTEELDGGPVAIQAVANVLEGDDEASLKERVHTREHLIYPIAVRWFLEGRLKLDGEVAKLDGHNLPVGGLRLSHADVEEELSDELPEGEED